MFDLQTVVRTIPAKIVRLLTSSANESLSRKNLKSWSFWSTGWVATFRKHCSRAPLRRSTNPVSNRPNECFSGTGGTTTPGLLFDNVSYNHRKSEYRLNTENEDFENTGEVVWSFIEPINVNGRYYKRDEEMTYLRMDCVHRVTSNRVAYALRIIDCNYKYRLEAILLRGLRVCSRWL